MGDSAVLEEYSFVSRRHHCQCKDVQSHPDDQKTPESATWFILSWFKWFQASYDLHYDTLQGEAVSIYFKCNGNLQKIFDSDEKGL